MQEHACHPELGPAKAMMRNCFQMVVMSTLPPQGLRRLGGEVAMDVPKMGQEKQQEHEGMAEKIWWTEHHGDVFVAHPWGRAGDLTEMDKEPVQRERKWMPQGNEAPLRGERRLAGDRVWRKGVYTADLGTVKP